MIGVKYVSAARNPSGYGEAARQFITSLFCAGVNLTCETISQMPEETDYGITGVIEKQLRDREINHKVIIIHLTPDLIPNYKVEGEYTISHLFWECSLLPKEWVTPLNTCDEIWTASDQMSEMIKNSGVSTPCYAFSQPIDTTKAYEVIKPYRMEHLHDFTFYSIFQWIDRKNPRTLLRAYWQEFSGNEKVTLLIKTYRITYLPEELQLIKNDITNWKKELDLKHYPKIYLAHTILTESQMWRFHQVGDVFISPSSGEGWNRPLQEAMLLGKPCISGDVGGITDTMTSNYYYKVGSRQKHATTQPWIPWYSSDMCWKELDELELRIRMRNVLEDYQSAQMFAKKAQQYVVDNFGFFQVGLTMKQRLEKISKLTG